MKKGKIITIALAACALCAGCSTAVRVQGTPVVRAAEETVTTDVAGTAEVSASFSLPDNYLSSRSRLIVSPQLMAEDSILADLEPVVLDAPIFNKKNVRRQALEGVEDPYAPYATLLEKPGEAYEFVMSRTVALPQNVERARLVAVMTAEGCGSCASVDTMLLASLKRAPLPRLEALPAPQPQPEPAKTPVIHKGMGLARIQFIVDKWDIEMDLANNRRELGAMLDSLRLIIDDPHKSLLSLDIFGSASVEAPYDHNVMLAENRARTATEWLLAQLGRPEGLAELISIGAMPEGWEPVIEAMEAAGDPDARTVREIVDKYPGPTDDVAEKYIRRLPCWPRIRDRYLAPDRKVIYEYTWTERKEQ